MNTRMILKLVEKDEKEKATKKNWENGMKNELHDKNALLEGDA